MSKFRAAEIFSDYMVLQRGKSIALFGTGEDGTEIFGELGGFRTSCMVRNGKWQMIFPPMGAAKYMEIELSDGDPEDTVVFENVAIGEVWLASGQEDMELPLKLSENGKADLENLSEDADSVRFFSVSGSTNNSETKNVWITCADKAAAENQSAAGFYFAKELSRCFGVTVGIISLRTQMLPISQFINKDCAINEAEACFENHASFNENDKNNENLREKMLLPIAPYTMSGVLFYHGEADKNHPGVYYSLLTRLIRDWREDLHNDELPFIIGQLAMNGSENPGSENLSIIREAQMRVYKTVKNTGIAVLADCGVRNSAKDKETIGIRFARQAHSLVYGGCDGAFSPMINFAVWRGKTVELNFTNALGGFKVNGEPDGFEICGDDGVFVPAYADLSGERIFVTAGNVEHPRGVRYLWKDSSDIHITNGFGLPLAPFRIGVV